MRRIELKLILVGALVLANSTFVYSNHPQSGHRRGVQPAQPGPSQFEGLPQERDQADGGRSDNAYLYFPYTVSGINGI